MLILITGWPCELLGIFFTLHLAPRFMTSAEQNFPVPMISLEGKGRPATIIALSILALLSVIKKDRARVVGNRSCKSLKEFFPSHFPALALSRSGIWGLFSARLRAPQRPSAGKK